ncbi:MAG: hypothetical protein WCF62_28910, partial [Pseudolabrys sp.]
MAKKKNGVVPLRLVVQRINRKLAAKGQILIKATLWMRMVLHYGDYYILDLNGKVIDTHIDPKKLARKLRSPAPLQPWADLTKVLDLAKRKNALIR